MKKYKEVLLMVLISAVIGGGIFLIQNRGVFGVGIFKDDPLSKYMRELEQIGRCTHDYMNGYIYGKDCGTNLPTDAMKEEANSLQARFELVDQDLALLYSDEQIPTTLLEDFRNGFSRLQVGLANNNERSNLEAAHKIFEKIDYGYFHHKQGDEVILRH